jgi:ribose 5-phosphate isomerase A
VSGTSKPEQDHLKRLAAAAAVAEVEDGMVLGLGSGSTAAFAVEALAARVAQGLDIVAIPTSERTATQARRLGIGLSSFAEHRRLDMTIDGADEVEIGTLNLIKGRGGALLREKIVASASDRMVVIVDEGKLVDRLGQHVRVPVEIVPFGWQVTLDRLADLGARPTLRVRAISRTGPTAATTLRTARSAKSATRRTSSGDLPQSRASSRAGCSWGSPRA